VTWRQSLREATFRGVPFHISTRSGQGGRRLAEHEFPLRDVGAVEDLGRATPRFQITGYVLGADYLAKRDRLIEALEAAGPGAFLDRYGRGEISVQCQRFRYTERDADGGYCEFTIEFVDAGVLREPAASVDSQAVLRSSLDSLDAESGSAFAQAFTTAGLPDVAEVEARGALQSVAQVVGAALGGRPGAVLAALANVPAVAGVLDATGIPAALVGAMTDAIAGRSLGRVAEAMLTVAATPLAIPALAETTPTRRQRNRNVSAIGDLMHRTALSTIGRATAGADIVGDLVSYQEAETFRLRVVEQIDAEMATASDRCEAGVVRSLAGFAGGLSADVAARGQSLPLLRTARTNAPRSAIALSHRLHGSLDGVDDLNRRARVPHPGFLPTVIEHVSR
jgi:prophage DNA circulation protein